MAVWAVVKKNELEGSTRIDAEYYQPKYLSAHYELSRLNVRQLTSFCSYIKKGIFDLSPDNYCEQGIPFVRTTEIKKEIADFDSAVYIPEEIHKKYKKTELRSGDIVFTKIGANIGDSSILPTLYKHYNFSQNVAGAKIKQNEINPYYLAAYLSSKYGKFQLKRVQMLSGQGKLELADIRNMLIFNADERKQESIAIIYKEAEELVLESKKLYSKAEQILLEELGLKDLDLKDDLFYATTLKEVKDNNRMDAEYYIPKYEELIAHIMNYKNGYCGLFEIAQNITTNHDPLKEGEHFRYIELSNIQASIGIIENAKRLRTEDAPSRAKRKLKKGDVIVSSIKGSLDKTAMVVSDFDGAFASNGFFQFRAKLVNPAYLTLLIKSNIVYLQLFREASGAILSAVPKESLKNIIIPKLDKNMQEEISKLVQNAHEKYHKSKLLLEQAKHKVEEMIEKEAGAR
jgi:restriction endonuclease S subunit